MILKALKEAVKSQVLTLRYIDGILNNTKLEGIGVLNYLGATALLLDNEISGYSLMYRAVYSGEDIKDETEQITTND